LQLLPCLLLAVQQCPALVGWQHAQQRMLMLLRLLHAAGLPLEAEDVGLQAALML
jgi:hypothetical protein